MAMTASEYVSPGAAGDRLQIGASPSLDPTERALKILADHGLKLVTAGNGPLRQSKFGIKFRLAFIKVRYFAAKARYIMLRGVCRLIGDPKEPRVKTAHERPRSLTGFRDCQ